MHERFVVGIDLGTTNCALAYADTAAEQPRVVALPDSAAGQRRRGAAPPAAAVVPLPPGGAGFSGRQHRAAVGPAAGSRRRRARAGIAAPRTRCGSSPRPSRGCRTAGRERTAPILPWGAPEEMPAHLAGRGVSRLPAPPRRRLRRGGRRRTPRSSRSRSRTCSLTVPASFDDEARELTLRGGAAAGLEQVTLLEEPQAAFYAWLDARRRPAGAGASRSAT